MVLQPVRGTRDIYGERAKKFLYLTDSARQISELYGFSEIQTPIMEHLVIFSSTLGAHSDVVSKQMYVLQDKNDHSLVLRPENTASVVRAVLTNSMPSNSPTSPLQFFYAGPMFRYERPQRGRFRQFHQIGVEHIGDYHPVADITVLSAAVHLLRTWNLLRLSKLEINTLGDDKSRELYHRVLSDYFKAHKKSLSGVSIERLVRGSVLRILDSKEAQDLPLIEKCPRITDFLSVEAKERWAEVLHGLDNNGIEYQLNPLLVRGLDYYDHTCFEFTVPASAIPDDSFQPGFMQEENAGEEQEGPEPQRMAILGGGRYNKLAAMLTNGQRWFPAVGWSAGVERLASLLSSDHPGLLQARRPIGVIAIGTKLDDSNQSAANAAFKLCTLLRSQGVPCLFFNNTKIRQESPNSEEKLVSVVRLDKNLQSAKAKCDFIVMLGGSEVADGKVTVRDMRTSKQEVIDFSHNIINPEQLNNLLTLCNNSAKPDRKSVV